jgi:hypothetical protein
MMAAYLFGDSSPSDLKIDYIEFLRDALDFSAQVLAADEAMRVGAARADVARRDGDAEAARLEALGAAQARAVEAFDAGLPDSPTSDCAKVLVRAGAEAVRAAVERVRSAVTADVGRIDEESRRAGERCSAALGVFLKKHDLPGMWSELRLQQQGGSGYVARLYLRGLDVLRAVLELEISPGQLLSSVVRVDKLMERLEVHAPESGGWLRKEVKLRPQRLDKEHITAFVHGGQETMIHLRTAADGSGVGYDLVLRGDEQPVSLRRIGEAGDLSPFDLDETDSSKVRELRDKLREETEELVHTRKALVEATVGEISLVEERNPRQLIERLVATMAPVVQEIGRRSLSPSELVLKRQTGDGRREEIFVARADLRRKLRGLNEATRALFAPLGLGEPSPGELAATPDLTPELIFDSAPTTAEKDKRKLSGGKNALDKSLFAEALAQGDKADKNDKAGKSGKSDKADKVDAEAKTVVPKGSPPPARRDDSVRLGDDSLERLIVSESEVRKPE